MQKLHVVGSTTDHQSLILSTRRGSRSGGYVLVVDQALREALAAADAASGAAATAVARPQSALSVREVQSRLRGGASIEEVAAEAGMTPSWVDLFAPPILAERARVVSDTRGAHYIRPRLGPSALPVGQAVYRNLLAKGVSATVEELDRGWSARQVADGRWLVTFAYHSTRRSQEVVWELDVHTGEVTAQDRLAGELAYVAPEPAAEVPDAAESEGGGGVPATAAAVTPTNRVAAARKAAEAQLVEAARLAGKRSRAAARRAKSDRDAPGAEPAGPPKHARADDDGSAPATGSAG